MELLVALVVFSVVVMVLWECVMVLIMMTAVSWAYLPFFVMVAVLNGAISSTGGFLSGGDGVSGV